MKFTMTSNHLRTLFLIRVSLPSMIERGGWSGNLVMLEANRVDFGEVICPVAIPLLRLVSSKGESTAYRQTTAL